MTDKRFDVVYGDEPFNQVVTDGGVKCTARYCAKILNELHEENIGLKNDCGILVQSNQEYREENEQLQERNDRQAKRLDNLYHLIEKEDWKTLKGLIQEFQECEEQLQKEWGTYGDVE